MKIIYTLLLLSCIIPTLLCAGITSIQQGTGRNVTVHNTQGQRINLYINDNLGSYSIGTDHKGLPTIIFDAQNLPNNQKNVFGDVHFRGDNFVHSDMLNATLFEYNVQYTSANLRLQDNNVTIRNDQSKISSGINTGPYLNNNIITSEKIINGTIKTEDISDNAITSEKILNGTIQSEDIANNSITMEKLSTNVQDEFTELKRAMAMQASLTMATQPLNDNKLTINLGYGNYKGYNDF